MDLKSYFTTDEEFQELEHRDATTNIIGYIDSILAPHEAGSNNDLLLKFGVSTGTKRIEVLIWGLSLINKYLSSLLSNRVKLQELEHRDATTNIIGYIDSILAPHEAGSNIDLLLKFGVSTGTKRIEVLIWGLSLINKYLSSLLSNRELEHRDATTLFFILIRNKSCVYFYFLRNIIGYIDSILTPHEAGSNNDLLLKFGVSTGTKRIEVLIWGLSLINKYLSSLLSNRAIDINGAYCKEVHQTNARVAKLQELEHRDATTNIIGYIDSILAPHEAGSNIDLLLKFGVSTGTKRIEVLIWGLSLINKYLSSLLSNRAIDINGAYCKEVHQTNARVASNLVPFELIIKEYTEISFLVYYNLNNSITNDVKSVSFEDIHAVEGLIGYIRSKFAFTHNRNGNMTYGLGAITDKVRKLTIQVKQFAESKLELGDYVTVRGSVTGQDSLVKIFCDSMNDISLNTQVESLSLEDIRQGNRPVKRARNSLVKIFCDSMNDISLNTQVESLSLEDIRRGNRPVKRARSGQKKILFYTRV
ncbi:hypothetical protein TSAR_016762 [Trichomalopsis sarcophagae]|uniref:Uncharacterized protein n=1 Tax=Trichomalopsis sarcophagae TaxID=543379 RepID=A0A232EZ69_9HYME|nr:hypothetical protein TSAR_016762 [Trichomalopsis sarcophagae]